MENVGAITYRESLLLLAEDAPVLQRRRHARPERLATAGRWSLLRPGAAGDSDALNHVEHIARVLLRRYGVVFRRVLERESGKPSTARAQTSR